MKRRNFMAASALAATGIISAQADEHESEKQFLELRHYEPLLGSKKGQLNDYLKNALVPAWNRQGIEPVGVFNVMFGENKPSVYVLLPHPSMESVVMSNRKLLEDDEFKEAAAGIYDASSDDPPYVRVESSLMVGFDDMPTVEIPEAVAGKNGRIFELRIYESHSEKAAKKKIEMFNEGGEIAIFKKTGLDPVFFGESLIGPNLPNLTYMLAFESLEARAAAWSNFVSHPDWKALSGDAQYNDTVSNITDIILRPMGFSQI